MNGQTICWTTMDVAGRSWTLLASAKGLCRILYPHESPESALPWLNRNIAGGSLEERPSVFEEFGFIDKLSSYFRGEPVSFDDVPTDLWGTPFQREVWAELGRIPYGQTRTYRDVAEAVGRPRAVRAVGAAVGANPVPVLLPCHRVLGAGRKLTGYRGGLGIKLELLKLEGVGGLEPTGHARFGF